MKRSRPIASHRLAGLVVTVAVAATLIGAGAAAIAAPLAAPDNYRGPARPAHQAAVTGSHPTSNYRGPARSSVPTTTVPARTNDPRTQKGSN
jgi:hypothetical protein